MAGGRPLKFQSVDELQEMIDAYFDTVPEEEWTVTGLALALDTTRDVLIDYQNKDEFSYAIKKAKERVHNAYEKDLRRKGRSGDIFALKNFGWTDKQEIDHTTKGKSLNFDDNQAKRIAAEILKGGGNATDTTGGEETPD